MFRAFASEEANVSETVGELPGALRQTTQTLQKVQATRTCCGPDRRRAAPASARSITPANQAVRPFAQRGGADPRDEDPAVRPRGAPARARTCARRRSGSPAATPDLTRSFVVLNNLFNMLGFNPNGARGPDERRRQEGYLFYIAWAGHQAVNLFATADVHGTLRPITVGGTCNTLKRSASEQAGAEFVLELVPRPGSGRVCNP